MNSNTQNLLTPDAFVLYEHRGKLVLLALGSAAFVAMSIFLWTLGGIKPRIAAVLGAAFFGFCLLIAIWRLVHRKPALIINHAGIFDGLSGFGAGMIGWNEIDGVYIATMYASLREQKFLSILLKDTDSFLQRQSPMKARMMKMNMGLLGAPVNIATASLALKAEQLLDVVRQKNPSIRVH